MSMCVKKWHVVLIVIFFICHYCAGEYLISIAYFSFHCHLISTKHVAVSSIEASSGSAGVAVYNEALQQVTITQDDEEASSEIVIVTGNDDQSKELWTDYAAAKSSETEASSQDKEERPSQEEFRMPQSQQKLRTEVDVTGSPRLKIASRGVIGEKSGGILVRKEGLNKFTTVPVGVSPSPQRRRFLQQSAKAEPIKHEGLRSPRVKNPEASPLTRYINNMATGKSIMIRAGEDCFEEIETISIADTYSENKPEIPTTPRIMDSDSTMNDSQMSVDSQMNVHFEASAASSTIMTVAEPPEVVITETGEKVHILKNGTSVEEEQETFDIPFEDMFDLLGKSCRCLVCGKIMLKRNRRYHWRFHTGAKPYVCSYCSKKFYHPSNLKSHLFIHTARNKWAMFNKKILVFSPFKH